MQPRHSACQGVKWLITPAVSDPFRAPFSWRARVGKRRDSPDIPRARLLKIKYLKILEESKKVQIPHNRYLITRRS